MREALVSVRHAVKTFQAGRGCSARSAVFTQVNDVSFDIIEGETFSLVGESGCGKSTTGRLVNHMLTPDSGEVWFHGTDISGFTEKQMRPLRKEIR